MIYRLYDMVNTMWWPRMVFNMLLLFVVAEIVEYRLSFISVLVWNKVYSL